MSARGPGSQGPARRGLGSQPELSLEAAVRVSSHRVLCETVKDFVARVGKAYEGTTESSEESEVMAKKVCPLGARRRVSGWRGTPSPVLCFPSSALS